MWISVKDKLPEDCEEMCDQDFVLVYADLEGDHERPISDLFGLANRYNKKWVVAGDVGVHDCQGVYTLSPDEITHWKQLDYPSGT